MCAKYVPPHLRNQPAGGEDSGKSGLDRLEESSAAAERGGKSGSRLSGGDEGWTGRSGGRDRAWEGVGGGGGGGRRWDFTSEEESSAEKGGDGGGRRDKGKSGGKGKDPPPRTGVQVRAPRFYREDGRRPNHWDEPSEQQRFGPRKSTTGISFDEHDKIPVQVSGRDADINVNIDFFAEAKLSDGLADNLWRCGYERPTPVQKHSIPIVCEGRDVMVCAQTGSREAVKGAGEWGEEPSPSRSVSTASGSACSDGGAGTPPWWTLVWCHERCHKEECEWKRAVIGEIALDNSATFVCFKKATKFAAWTAHSGRSPYGLLTDWREAKPCLEAAEACPPSARPAFVVIYCEQPKCHEHAAMWARARPPGAAPPVRIIGDLDLLNRCLSDLVGNLGLGRAPRGHPGPAPHGGRSQGRPPLRGSSAPKQPCASQPGAGELGAAARRAPVSRAPGSWAPSARAAADAEVEDCFQEARHERMRKERDSMWLHCGISAVHEQRGPRPQAHGAMTPHFQQAPMQAPMQPLAAGYGVFVGPACADAPSVQGCALVEKSIIQGIEHLLMETSADAWDGQQQIEAMLVSAMPDHYDD